MLRSCCARRRERIQELSFIAVASGGGTSSSAMRPLGTRERVYGIPPDQVIGSSIKTKYEVRGGNRRPRAAA